MSDRQGAGLLAGGARGAGVADASPQATPSAARRWPRRIAARATPWPARDEPQSEIAAVPHPGGVLPIKSLQEALAEGISVGHEGLEMPEFQFSPAQIDDLTAYLTSINKKKR